MLVGYARVSTSDQTLNLQHDALTKAGCTKIFIDTASGAQAERKGLTDALAYVRSGDTLVVWKLDRPGRSLKDLITRITELNDRKIGFKKSLRKLSSFPGARSRWERGVIFRALVAVNGCDDSDLLIS
jgi:DNA invertase Pin-like site-specific DNA recombinase